MIIACMSGYCMCQTIASSAETLPLFAGFKSLAVIQDILFRDKMQVDMVNTFFFKQEITDQNYSMLLSFTLISLLRKRFF